jgi:hypothetical protein
MRSDRYYNQAEKFMPERWIRGRPEAKKLHPYAFIPFSHGVSRVITPNLFIGKFLIFTLFCSIYNYCTSYYWDSDSYHSFLLQKEIITSFPMQNNYNIILLLQ